MVLLQDPGEAVDGAQRRAQVVGHRVHEGLQRLGALAHQHLQSLAVAGQLGLVLAPPGDVHEGHHRAGHAAILADGVAPPLHREAGAVGTPVDLLVRMGGLARRHGPPDGAVGRGIGRAVGAAVADALVHGLAHEILGAVVAQHAQAGGVDEGAAALQVHAVDGLGGGIQQQPHALLALAQGPEGALQVLAHAVDGLGEHVQLVVLGRRVRRPIQLQRRRVGLQVGRGDEGRHPGQVARDQAVEQEQGEQGDEEGLDAVGDQDGPDPAPQARVDPGQRSLDLQPADVARPAAVVVVEVEDTAAGVARRRPPGGDGIAMLRHHPGQHHVGQLHDAGQDEPDLLAVGHPHRLGQTLQIAGAHLLQAAVDEVQVVAVLGVELDGGGHQGDGGAEQDDGEDEPARGAAAQAESQG